MEDFKAAYLEDWLDTIESLPCELQRNFSLIRELDATSQNLIQNIEESTSTFIDTGKEKSAAERKEMLKSLTLAFTEALKHGEDKVNLAVQTYDMIDRHIRRLDADLMKFEDELTMTGPVYSHHMHAKQKGTLLKDEKRESPAKRRRGGGSMQRTSRRSSIPPLPPPSVVASAVAQPPPVNPKRMTRNSANNDSDKESFTSKKKEDIDIPSSEPLSTEEKASLDPNEPTYCICNNVSYGEMIACDNSDCDIEWFHYDCVGLDSPPKGKWYCDNCKTKFGL